MNRKSARSKLFRGVCPGPGGPGPSASISEGPVQRHNDASLRGASADLDVVGQIPVGIDLLQPPGRLLTGRSDRRMTSIWGRRPMTTESGAGKNWNRSGDGPALGGKAASPGRVDGELGCVGAGVSASALTGWIANATNRTRRKPFCCVAMVLRS